MKIDIINTLFIQALLSTMARKSAMVVVYGILLRRNGQPDYHLLKKAALKGKFLNDFTQWH
jgi:hypothetical protein